MSETLIVGGGLAGSAAATLLARQGAAVRLLEREREAHHKVCGEFLSVEAHRDLAALGLDPLRLGAAPIARMRLAAGKRLIESALPFPALGLSRLALDEALLELAAANGARIERGVRVTGIEEQGIASSIGPMAASRVLLATGKHDLRGAPRAAPSTREGYVGFKMHYRLSAREQSELADHIELVLFEGGYAGLQPIEGGLANLCLIVRSKALAALGGGWDALFAAIMREPHLARRLGRAEALFARPLTIANVPYGYVCDPSAAHPKGLYRIGDQAACTASLTGDGMALALLSARLAAEAIVAGQCPQAFHQALSRAVSRQVRRAMALQRIAEMPLALRPGLALAGLWPGLIGRLASATRLPYST